MQPLRWLPGPRRLSDRALVFGVQSLCIQFNNDLWRDDAEAWATLNEKLRAYVNELDRRISQGTLF